MAYNMPGGREEEKIRRCPVCGCTEHHLIGCGKHWSKHKKNPAGRCEIRRD